MKRMSLSLLLASSAAFASPVIQSPLRVDAEHSTRVMTALTLDESGYAALRSMSGVTLDEFVLADGVTVDLELVRREVYSADARLTVMTDEGEIEVERPELTLFGGYVAGDADSLVFLAFSPYGVEGFIETMGQTWIVSSGPFDQDLPIGVYNLTTLPEGVINWAEWECAADQLGQEFKPIEHEGMGGQRGSDCFLLEYAVETDQEYLGLFGGDQTAANTYMATLFGAVNEIYSRDFFTEVEVVWSRLWTTTDPWTVGDSVGQLYQWRDYWESNMGAVDRDLTHFLSGRGLGGGVAWLEAVCSNFNYGLSGNLSGFFPYPIEDNSAQNWDLMVVAHEGGHNVGAPHTHDIGVDNCAGGNCSVTPFGTIMSYCHLCPGGLANVQMHFHPQNINNHILPHLNSRTCDIDGVCNGVDFAFPGGLPELVAPDGSTTITVVVTGEGEVSPASGTGMFHFNTGDGTNSIPMTEGPAGTYTVNVPALVCGETVEFSFSVEGDDGQTYSSPSNGLYTATVGVGFTNVISMNFESDPGWSVENIDLTDGGWTRGIPVGGGDRNDPASDYDGSGRCWLTDNADGNSDVDGGPTRLTSTAMDLSGTLDPVFSYARWFSRDDNEGDDAFLVEFSDDNGATWTTAEQTNSSSSSWVVSSLRVRDFVSVTSQFRVRFSTWDNPNNSVLEAGVDALSIDELECGGNDCAADRNDDGSLDFFDVQDFLNDFTAQDASADMNSDGSWDFFDVQSYLNLFSAGCP